jgi:hypothetical protein
MGPNSFGRACAIVFASSIGVVSTRAPATALAPTEGSVSEGRGRISKSQKE